MPRFSIKRDGWEKPLLVLFGATDDRSYIDVDDDRVEVRFGFYHLEIPRDQIQSVAVAPWPWWGGHGWRIRSRDSIGLIGASKPVVRFRLQPRLPVRILRLPVGLRDFYVSVEDPDGLLEALGQPVSGG